ncbi:MAG: glycosyltransferase [Oscillospiraceae bacterium]
MAEKRTVCLMNDSFPPLIDGVANTVVNYAACFQKNHGNAIVATPFHPDAVDDYPFPVVRYRSFDTTKLVGYRAGYPFSVEAMRQMEAADIDVIHSHCPFVSTILARTLRDVVDAPVIFTYHTKFDIDIAKILSVRPAQEKAVRLVVKNVQACDEVWVVSRGAGENLRSLGYEGDYRIMENGVEFPKGRIAPDRVAAVTGGVLSPTDTPVYLFVGRMMWYKGLRIIFDALRQLKAAGQPFRMVLIGDGEDRPSMENYAAGIGLADDCIFTGAIRDREALQAWYSRGDLFLFPSTYDTNGIVVREAASCGLASVLIEGSCAAEGITDGRNGYLIQENAASMAALLTRLAGETAAMHQVGDTAMEEIYLSWEDSVARAAERYEIVLDRYRSGQISRKPQISDGFIKATSELMEGVQRARNFRDDPVGEIRAIHDLQRARVGRIKDSFWQYLDRYL